MEPIQKAATHELVVERLRSAIHLGEYLPGDRLPSERDIAEKLDVSRETVREAIRTLEREGYVTSRRGSTGGHAVTELAEPERRTLEKLKIDRESLTHLGEFRRVNECLAARLAADRRREEDLARMAVAVEDLTQADNIQKFRKADAAFHLSVAVASRNPHVQKAVVDTREQIFLLHGGLDYKLILQTTLDSHRCIFDAVRDQDADRAEKEMARHMDVALDEIRNVLLGNAGQA